MAHKSAVESKAQSLLIVPSFTAEQIEALTVLANQYIRENSNGK